MTAILAKTANRVLEGTVVHTYTREILWNIYSQSSPVLPAISLWRN